MRKREKKKFNTIFFIIVLLMIFFISIGYSILSEILKINGTSKTQVSNSIGTWNITTSWVDNKVHYYQFTVKIDNRDGPVADNEREISFKVPVEILLDKCNIWVAESIRLAGGRLYMKCYSWATNQQPITLSFQLAFSKAVDRQITNVSFKNRFLSNFTRDPRLK